MYVLCEKRKEGGHEGGRKEGGVRVRAKGRKGEGEGEGKRRLCIEMCVQKSRCGRNL